MVYFSNRLKRLRKLMSLSQEELGKRLSVTKSMVSAYETSMRMPSYEVLLRMARLFGVSTDYLLGLDGREMLGISQLSDAQKLSLYQLMSVFEEKK